MKKSRLILALFLPGMLLSAQIQEPEAKEILDEVSAHIKTCETVLVDFNLTITDRVEDQDNKNSGTLYIKGDKYKVESPGMEIIFDGKTMWSYNEEINEVNVTEPDPENEDFVENPSLIFSFYNRDFKYRYDGLISINGVDVHEIELFPIKLDQPYSRIIIHINKTKNTVEQIKSVGKEGIDYTIKLSNQQINKPMEDSFFQFNAKKYKNLEIIDLR